MEKKETNFNIKDVIDELLLYYKNMTKEIMLEEYSDTNMNEKCIDILIKGYLYDKNEDEAVSIAIYCIENNEIIKCNLLGIVENFYYKGVYELFSKLAQMLIHLRVKENQVDMSNEIESLLPCLAESYLKMGNNHKLNEILKYYEDNSLELTTESYGYEEIKELPEQEKDEEMK